MSNSPPAPSLEQREDKANQENDEEENKNDQQMDVLSEPENQSSEEVCSLASLARSMDFLIAFFPALLKGDRAKVDLRAYDQRSEQHSSA